jgi:hypothetical protein
MTFLLPLPNEEMDVNEDNVLKESGEKGKESSALHSQQLNSKKAKSWKHEVDQGDLHRQSRHSLFIVDSGRRDRGFVVILIRLITLHSLCLSLLVLLRLLHRSQLLWGGLSRRSFLPNA